MVLPAYLVINRRQPIPPVVLGLVPSGNTFLVLGGTGNFLILFGYFASHIFNVLRDVLGDTYTRADKQTFVLPDGEGLVAAYSTLGSL